MAGGKITTFKARTEEQKTLLSEKGLGVYQSGTEPGTKCRMAMTVQTNRAKWQVRECLDCTDLERLFHFRYAEYVEKKGLFQDTADHKNQQLTDPSDSIGVNFLADSAGEVIGSIRMNDFRQFVPTYCIEEFDIQEVSPDIFKKGCMATRAMVRADWRASTVFIDLSLTVAKHMRDSDLRWMFVATGVSDSVGEEERFVSMYQSLGFRIWRECPNIEGTGPGKVMLFDMKEAMANPKSLARAYLC